MRKAVIASAMIVCGLGSGIAVVTFSRYEHVERSWPATVDAVCAAVMAARPPDLVLAGNAPDADVLSTSPAWELLDAAPRPLIRLAGFLHVERGRLDLYSSYERAYMAWRSHAGLVEESDVLDLPVGISTRGLWRKMPPAVGERCVVVEGNFRDGLMRKLYDVRRLSVWVDPYRPYPDFSFIWAEFPTGASTAQPVGVW